MKRIDMNTVLIMFNIGLALIIIVDSIFKFLPPEKHNTTGWLWITVVVVSVIYKKLDDIEKQL